MFGRKKKPEIAGAGGRYDYATREGRETTAANLHQAAANARSQKEREWVRCNDYYNFIHDAPDEVREAVREQGIPWDMAVVPDPYIMVESQIDPVVPEPEFRGRDDDLDSAKAKRRECAVKYILQENRIEDKNTANERRLRKLGDAFWKAYWDADMNCGPYDGNIRLADVPVEAIYPDPTAGADGLQEGQFVDYVYRLHKLKFWRMFRRDLEQQGLTLEDIENGEYREGDQLFDLSSGAGDLEDTIQICEHWFKQPCDTKDATAGAVACSMLAGGHEVRYIQNYWENTGRQNQLFPFVHYWCIRDENDFWNKSELTPILTMVDAADRELSTALLNNAMMANDIIIREEGALADGCEISNVPGSEIITNENKLDRVRRLGGLHDGGNSIPMIEWILSQIARTNRNYETNLGKETARVTTASGLAQLRSDADGQSDIKRSDRNRGFERLYELLDWLALEFFDDNRMIFLGAKKPEEEPVQFRYNRDDFAQETPPIADAMTGEIVREAYTYYPKVDVTVNAGDGIIRSKQATLQVLDKLAATPVTADNYKILGAQLDILDIPQKQEILELWERKFASNVPPEVVQALGENPELLGMVTQVLEQGNAGLEQMQ